MDKLPEPEEKSMLVYNQVFQKEVFIPTDILLTNASQLIALKTFQIPISTATVLQRFTQALFLLGAKVL